MLSFLSNIKILPVVIFSAVMMLTVKANSIWEGFNGWQASLTVSQAEAEQKPLPPEVPVPGERDLLAESRAQAEALAEVAAAQTLADPQPFQIAQANTDEAPPAPEGTDPELAEESPLPPGLPDDPTFYTQAEVDLLQQLAERRDILDEKENELDVREQLLRAAEARIDEKVEGMRQLEAVIESRIKVHDEQQDEKMVSLVKIYENMKPKDAAAIFEQLEMDIMLDVAERMNERRLAPILAKMNPIKAKEVTEELARLRSLPTDDEISQLR